MWNRKKATLLHYLHTSVKCVKWTFQRWLHFRGKGNQSQVVNCSFVACSALRNWEKQQRGDMGLWLNMNTGQPGSENPFTSLILRQKLQNCLRRFPQGHGTVALTIGLRSLPIEEHPFSTLTSSTTTGPHNTSPYNFNNINPYFNISMKFNKSSLSRALHHLFSGSWCCRQLMWQMMPCQPSWSCTPEILGKGSYETAIKKSFVDSLQPKPETWLLPELLASPCTFCTKESITPASLSREVLC